MNCTVSVLVLSFNQKGFIRATLNGILMQKVNFNYEIVIGEDCSTDGTRGIVFDYAKKYLRKI
jgi:glycosyltransferase involved in cell wall biosynthesis